MFNVRRWCSQKHLKGIETYVELGEWSLIICMYFGYELILLDIPYGILNFNRHRFIIRAFGDRDLNDISFYC